MKKILIIGAASAIASACARLWAADKAEFFMVARNPERLRQTADDLAAHGAGAVHVYALDMNQLEQHALMLEACYGALGSVDIALVAHGTLPDQAACQQDVALALREFSSNGLSVVSVLTLLANRMEAQRSGTIAVISSVAGDRGRYSNYLYGTAKAAVSTFCEGMRARLFHAGVHVLTIKPGFVDTPMTKGLPLPGPLVATPGRVARDITRAVERRANVLYTPGFWALIMLVIKCVPGFIFKRLKL
ncbi:MAG: SDR family oxidoreductase [Rhodoferax sp.]|nr:SDR family oxidoreductase [Rhodoferax sp.]